MSKEKIDLTTAEEGDNFITRNGTALKYEKKGYDNYPHRLRDEKGYIHHYTNKGDYWSIVAESEMDITSKVVEPSEQEVFNTNTKKALSELTSALEGIQARDRILARLLEFNEGRLGSADRKIDILMGERSTPKMGEVKELPKYYNEPVSMSWYDALTKYEDHPDYRMMTKEELLDEYEDNPNNLLDAAYWCSDEWSKSYAHSLRGGNGSTYAYEKRYPLKVRVVSREMVDCEVNPEGQLDKSQDEGVSKTAFKEARPESIKAFDKAIEEYIEGVGKRKNSIISDALDRIGENLERRGFKGYMGEAGYVDSLDKELDSIAETTITPKALLDLGFEESYQHAMEGSEGYIYYEFEKHGISMLSAMSHEKPFYVFIENQREIHSLEKLTAFVSAIKSL